MSEAHSKLQSLKRTRDAPEVKDLSFLRLNVEKSLAKVSNLGLKVKQRVPNGLECGPSKPNRAGRCG